MDLRKGSHLKPGMRKCFRCSGRKKMYKVGSAWSIHNCGGEYLNCPMCDGTGQIKTLDKLDEQIKEILTKPDVKKRSRKSKQGSLDLSHSTL